MTFGVPGPKQLTVEAEITDLNQQTIARIIYAHAEFVAVLHRAERNRNAYYAGGSADPDTRSHTGRPADGWSGASERRH